MTDLPEKERAKSISELSRETLGTFKKLDGTVVATSEQVADMFKGLHTDNPSESSDPNWTAHMIDPDAPIVEQEVPVDEL